MDARITHDMEDRAEEVSAVLKGLANRNRLMIVCTLAKAEHSVAELETMLGIRQPTLSQQLTALREAGIVLTRREGKHVFYRLSDEKPAQLVGALYEIYCGGGAR